MSTPRSLVARAARAGSAPARRYLNRHVESVKDEVRAQAAAERHASEFELRHVHAALDRLEEAIGFLGMQLTVVRTMLEEGAGGVVVAEDATHAEVLAALGFRRLPGSAWARSGGAPGPEDRPA